MKKIIALTLMSLVGVLAAQSCDVTSSIISEITSSISSLSSSGCEHSWVDVKKVEPTCQSEGCSAYSYCEKCGEYRVEKEILPKVDHKYVPYNLDFTKKGTIDRKVDCECIWCQDTVHKSIGYEDYEMPIVDFHVDMNTVSKESKTKGSFTYIGKDQTFEKACTFKVQGGSSVGYPKKNFNVQFLDENGNKEKVLINEDWGKQSKYTLKANYIDYSQARNVCSAKLYREIIKEENKGDALSNSSLCGVVDGFPVIAYANGEFWGLYTFNTAKDNYLFNMKGSTTHQALLQADTWDASPGLTEFCNDECTNGWSLEYCSTEDESEGISWVAPSINRCIQFLLNSGSARFKSEINEYFDLDRVIDAFIFTYFAHACDNTSKNIIWATYDGNVWIPSIYDFDGSWGLVWNGYEWYDYNDFTYSNALAGGTSRLWHRVFNCFKDEIKERYAALRETVLSFKNIRSVFTNFMEPISDNLYTYDATRWVDVPSHGQNDLQQILRYAKLRGAFLDEDMANC